MYLAEYWDEIDKNGVICTLCPHKCRISVGKAGLCGGRQNVGGELMASRYGLVSSLALDPIEKKPLRRFYPGSQVLSIGGFGCNFRCPFCQNYSISLEYDADEGELLSVGDVLAYARGTVAQGNIGVAYTYNEPLINYEFVRDCAAAVREAGLKNVLVTNGFINEGPLRALLPYIDAMNIDLKAFSADFYGRVSGMGGAGAALEVVKGTIAIAAAHCHVEVTTLVIPGENEGDVAGLAEWLASVGVEIPLHLTRFYPRYRYEGRGATDAALIGRLAEGARRWLRWVY